MKKTLVLLSAALIGSMITAGAQTIISDFGPDQTTVSWSNLSNQNPTRTPDAGSATGVSLTPVGAFAATAGIYSPIGNYTIGIASSNTYTDLHAVSVVFRATYETLSTVALLTYDLDGVTVSSPITATLAQLVPGTQQVWVDAIDGFTTYDQYLYAWDLSDVNGVITNLKIEASFFIHTSIVMAEANFGSEYNTPSVVAVPEPSTYALIAGAFGLAAVVVARRRRA